MGFCHVVDELHQADWTVTPILAVGVAWSCRHGQTLLLHRPSPLYLEGYIEH